jgi:hypothetical protein
VIWVGTLPSLSRFHSVKLIISGAALTGADSHELQEVLEETNVSCKHCIELFLKREHFPLDPQEIDARSFTAEEGI